MSANAPKLPTSAPGWKVEDSAELYQVDAWGGGYFAVNPAGHVVVRPDQDTAREIDLHEVVEGLKARDLTAPVVVRFSDILAHRLRHLRDAFAQASVGDARVWASMASRSAAAVAGTTAPRLSGSSTVMAGQDRRGK